MIDALPGDIRERLADVAITLDPYPPPDEQAAIVRFLDHAHNRIDRRDPSVRREHPG